MKRNLIIMLLPFLAGCAYLHDRTRDACDIVTVAAEAPSVNVSVRVFTGMLGIGLTDGKGVGLRSGALGVYETGESNIIFAGFKTLAPSEADLDRDKGYAFQYFWFPLETIDKEFGGILMDGKWFNAWQIEATLGLGIGVRAGINLAETLDFVLGWTTLDICGDDTHATDRREAQACQESTEATEE